MDKVKQYESAILAFLNDYAGSFSDSGDNEVETQVIADKEGKHYQLYRVGWRGTRYIHLCLFHFDIKNDKVWIQQNETEELVADELVKRGVAREDIVLGFEPAFARPYSGFAVG